MIFVDYISIRQYHPGRFNTETGELEPRWPVVDSGVVGKWGRDDAGEMQEEPEWASRSKLHIKGSYDSLVIVRCDGYTVELEGNVGRLNRPDNVFNLDFDATIAACNEILAGFGLPPFTAGEEVANLNPSDYDLKHSILTSWTGASISRLDLTRNYETGSITNAQATIDWLATQSLSNIKRGRGGQTSCAWGSLKGRKLITAYIKAPEMLAPGHKHGRTSEQIKADSVYQYCLNSGLVRIELKAQRLLLRDLGLRYLGEITMPKLVSLYESEVDPLLNRTREDLTSLDIEQLPKHVRMTAAAYLRGENVRRLLSNGAFYRQAKVLRGYGIDIAEPLANASKFTSVIKVIEISPVAAAPDWYWQHQDKLSAIASPASDVPAANDDYVALPAAVGDYEPASPFVPQIVDLSVLLPDRFGPQSESNCPSGH